MRYSVIIPAAGSGSRMKASVPKVLLSLTAPISEPLGISQSDGLCSPVHTILGQTVQCFFSDPLCDRVVVCYPAAWKSAFEAFTEFFPQLHLVEGGTRRQVSVFNGVQALQGSCAAPLDSIVLVHDAARCNVRPEVIERVLKGVLAFGAVTAALPVVDSLCRVGQDEAIAEYVNRAAVYAVQTPQGFYLSDLLLAHQAAQAESIEGLDDASLVARFRSVKVVLGDFLNIKVTHPLDLVLAKESRLNFF